MFKIKFLFISLLYINITYSCNNIEIHKKIIDKIFHYEGEKILKTKSEYSKYGIRNFLLLDYNLKYNTNYNLKTLTKKNAQVIALDLMQQYNINKINDCNLKFIAFDTFYNTGPKAGALIIQKTLNKYNKSKLIEDGIIGKETLKSLNHISSLPLFKSYFLKERLDYYSRLKNWNKYKNGWTNRVFSVIKNNFYCNYSN